MDILSISFPAVSIQDAREGSPAVSRVFPQLRSNGNCGRVKWCDGAHMGQGTRGVHVNGLGGMETSGECTDLCYG